MHASHLLLEKTVLTTLIYNDPTPGEASRDPPATSKRLYNSNNFQPRSAFGHEASSGPAAPPLSILDGTSRARHASPGWPVTNPHQPPGHPEFAMRHGRLTFGSSCRTTRGVENHVLANEWAPLLALPREARRLTRPWWRKVRRSPTLFPGPMANMWLSWR